MHAFGDAVNDETSLPAGGDETVVAQAFQILGNLDLFAADAVDDAADALRAV